MEGVEIVLDCFAGKRVFITGHTGFKGAWLTKILDQAGAHVTGYSLEPPTNPNLYSMLSFSDRHTSILGDVRDFETLTAAINECQPETVFHLAAQPLVRHSYENPLETYETNVMGTVNLLETVRGCASIRSVINVTTDKVYLNDGRLEGYREDDTLDGHDPYSNSKSCSELVSGAYRNSFFSESGVALSTVRAGNVIGGGDFSEHRLVPDCVRSTVGNEPIVVRNPDSVRPFQHVLEPLRAYLVLSRKQMRSSDIQGAYNVGPRPESVVTTAEVASKFCVLWGEGAHWVHIPDEGPHEAKILTLSSEHIARTLGIVPKLTFDQALDLTVEWYRAWSLNGDVNALAETQINAYFEGKVCS